MRYGVGVAAGCVARCPSSEAEMNGYNAQGITQVSALGSSEVSTPQRLKFISIMGDSNGGRATVHSRGGVPSREGCFRRFHSICIERKREISSLFITIKF